MMFFHSYISSVPQNAALCGNGFRQSHLKGSDASTKLMQFLNAFKFNKYHLTLSLLMTTQEAFVNNVDQDLTVENVQTAQNVQSDL